jgi:hypothetical protein
MGDRRKCQTFAASPAEPGGLPVMLGSIRLVHHNVAVGGFWGHALADSSSDPHLEQVWDFRSFFTLAPPRISANSASTRFPGRISCTAS